jgi:hypothetical protein
MPYALIAGPAVALIGIVSIFFVLRRKSVDKRSMYSARRSQIEHKVRAARQRTLTGRGEKPAETTVEPMPGTTFAPQGQVATYEPSAFEPPPAAIPQMGSAIQEAPSASPWDVGPAAPPQPPFAAPSAPPPYQPAPAEEVWTPAPAPAPPPPPSPSEPLTPREPLTPAEPARPVSPAAPAAWSVVGEAKESAVSAEPEPKRKKGRHQDEAAAGSWQLASGNAPGVEPEEVIKAPGQGVAIAQYAVLVVGLVAVLIGVLIMVAGSPVK